MAVSRRKRPRSRVVLIVIGRPSAKNPAFRGMTVALAPADQ
jgi:hypothetical protein